MSVSLNAGLNTPSAIVPFSHDPRRMMRTEINAEMNLLFNAIYQPNMNDPFTESIKIWYQAFSQESRERLLDLEHTVGLFTEQLQRLLRSPIPPYEPLDHDVLLGTDGHTYGKKSLLVFLSGVKRVEGEHYRSPLAPHEDNPFFVRPHPVGTALVAWLERHSALVQSEDLNRRYDSLLLERRIPPLPLFQHNHTRQPRTINNHEERRRQLVARRQEREEREMEENRMLVSGLNKLRNMADEIRGTFNAVKEETSAQVMTNRERINALTQNTREQGAASQDAVVCLKEQASHLQSANRSMDRQIAELQQTIEGETQGHRRVTRALDQARHTERLNDELAALTNTLETQGNQANAAFQEAVEAITNNLEENRERTEALKQLDVAQGETLNNNIRELVDGIAGLEQNNGALDNNIQQLQGTIQEHEQRVRRATHIIDQARHTERHNEELAALTNTLETQGNQANTAFQEAVEAITNNLEENRERTEALNQLDVAHGETLNNNIRELVDGIAGLEQENGDLDNNIQQLQGTIQEHEQRVRRATHIIDKVRQEKLHRQELNHLLELLNRLPDPVVQEIAPFRRKMAEDFLKNEERVAALEEETKEQLTELQKEILKSSLKKVSEELNELDEENKRLETQATLLTDKCHEAERAQVQLQQNINKVEKIIKKQNKAGLQGLLTAVAVGVGCALVTAGVSYLVQGVTVTSAGLNGAKVTFAIAF